MLYSSLLWPALALAAASTPAPASPGSTCPDDMVLIRGVHHEQLQRICTDYRQGHCFAFFPGLTLVEPRATPIHTCMDRYEWPNQAGRRPQVMMRFVEAEAACQAVGKRLCTEFEWELACEGPEHMPWPYGWKKQRQVCNSDKRFRSYSESRLNSPNRVVRDRETARIWQGAASGAFPECRSAYGVMDMIGNVEEWVSTSRPQWPYRSSLKGGYWAKPWTGCRGTNERHGPQFRYYEIGFRCCRKPDA